MCYFNSSIETLYQAIFISACKARFCLVNPQQEYFFVFKSNYQPKKNKINIIHFIYLTERHNIISIYIVQLFVLFFPLIKIGARLLKNNPNKTIVFYSESFLMLVCISFQLSVSSLVILCFLEDHVIDLCNNQYSYKYEDMIANKTTLPQRLNEIDVNNFRSL